MNGLETPETATGINTAVDNISALSNG